VDHVDTGIGSRTADLAGTPSVPVHERTGQQEGKQGMKAPVTKPGNSQAKATTGNGGSKIRDMGEGHIMGNLTHDPDLRYTPTGRGVCKLRVAYTPRVKDSESGEWKDADAEYYDIQVWGKQGERCADALERGDRIVCAGTWVERTWQDREGNDRVTIELTARDIGPSMLFRDARVKRTQATKGGSSDNG
jgi:single-strand DNA-binding protein